LSVTFCCTDEMERQIYGLASLNRTM